MFLLATNVLIQALDPDIYQSFPILSLQHANLPLAQQCQLNTQVLPSFPSTQSKDESWFNMTEAKGDVMETEIFLGRFTRIENTKTPKLNQQSQHCPLRIIEMMEAELGQ